MCNGNSEGDFRITGNVRPTGTTGVVTNGVPWREYRVHMSQIDCIEESDWDRGTSSDEPFVLGLIIPHGGAQPIRKWRTAPFNDVDSGDTRSLNRDFNVRVPQHYGFISVACAVYESDDESSSDRDELLDEFAAEITGQVAEAEGVPL
jgi:hypothetical protein